jgi:hypothetical protein
MTTGNPPMKAPDAVLQLGIPLPALVVWLRHVG